jgi:hypothetical protein
VQGATSSTDFPTTPGAFQTSLTGVRNVFVAKLAADGSALVYSTYLGGSGMDGAGAIALDSAGDVYVTGPTSSHDFPTVSPLQPTYGGDPYDDFVTELNADGSALAFSTYLGGSGIDLPGGIALDSAGDVYVTGTTASRDFPTANALQPTYGGGVYKAFVTKISNAGP